jgi:RNA polymerase sigma-70 factor (ECF subfamily)
MRLKFLTTHLTSVLASRGQSPEARQALSDLCATYYEPVLAFVRQSGHDPDAARDLAHEFFAGLLERHGLGGADPARGRFRTYLLGAVKHFLANQHAARIRAKRGAGAVHERIGVATDTSPGLEILDCSSLPPDAVFDREWALGLINRALAFLAREAEQSGAGPQFEKLKPWLAGARAELSQAEIARELQMSDGAVRVAIHRLRRRFRELVKAEIAQTVGKGSDVDQELAYLISVLA